MATAVTTTDERQHNLTTQSIQDAIQDLVNSCGIHDPDGQVPTTNRYSELQQACEELREKLPFHSEEGRHLVIVELTKLNGNYVVKIVRRGLCSLSKVYSSDTKTFENEATELVKLCCLQYAMQTSSEGGHQVASPAIVIDWTIELCDELMKPSSDSLFHDDQDTRSIGGAFLVKSLAKLSEVYKSIISGRMKILEGSGLVDKKAMDPFKSLFDAVKTRIKFKGFVNLIEQTAAIVKTEENLNFLNLSSTGGSKIALILEHWISLLKIPFVTNWLAFTTAKHDFLVHDGGYAQSLPFSDKRTYGESLIVQVVGAFNFLTSSNKQYQLSCDKTKLQVFFDNSEALLRHTIPCLQLMQADVETSVLKEIFFLLQFKLNRDLLPRITDSDKKQCQPLLDAFDKIILSPDHLHLQAIMEAVEATQVYEMKTLNQIISSSPHQTASFNAITLALLALPEKQKVLTILRIWKHTFPDDISYLMLSELFVLVEAIIQTKKESVSSSVEKFIVFLLQLPPDLFSALRIWRPLVEHLLVLLPHSCYGPEVINLIRIFVDLHIINTLRGSGQELSQVFAQKVLKFLNFLVHGEPVKQDSKSEEVKIKALKLGLELFEEVTHPEEYEFVLNVILSVASDMQTNAIKTFTRSLLKTARVHITRIQYPKIWEVISLIDQSRSIRRKSEVFESYLKLLQEIKHDDIIGVVNTCSSFLQLPVALDTDSIKRFFAVAATEGRLKICQFILHCFQFNQKILTKDSRVHKHMIVLLSIIEKTLCRENSALFFESVHRYMQLQMLFFPNIDIFEIILASIAGCIAVNTFNSHRFEAVLRVVQAAVHTREKDPPNAPDVLSLFILVAQTIDHAQRFGKKAGFDGCFAGGLCPIAKLPLSLPQITGLMKKVTLIIEKEKITNEQKLFNVMFHLFQLPNNQSASSLESDVLDLHFEEVVKPEIVRNVAEIPLMQKQYSNGIVSLFSLMEVLVERMPETFAKRTSASLYQFIIERVERNPQLSCSIFPVVETITKRRVSEAKLKNEIEEIEELLLRVPHGFIPLIGKCLRECYVVGLSDEKQRNIKCLIVHIVECLRQSHLNVEDGRRMVGSILGIPKQLVLTFKEATTSDEEVRKGMTKILDVVKTLAPEFIAGSFLPFFFPQDLNAQLKDIIQHDFYMLLKHTSLAAVDLSTALLVYQSLKHEGLLNVFNLSRNPDFKTFFEQWSSGTNQPEIPVPGNLANLVMQHLRRLKVPDIQSTTIEICCTIFSNCSFSNIGQMPMMGILDSPSPKEYLDLIISVMKESSHLAEIQHWLAMDSLFAVQCKDVIKATCFWKAGRKSCEAAVYMNTEVSKTLSILCTKGFPNAFPFSGGHLSKELAVMALVINTYEDENIAVKLFELLCASTECAEACADVVLSWSKEESLLLINKITDWFKKRSKMEANLEQLNNEIRIPLQVLSFAAKAFPNSAEDVFNFLSVTTENNGPEDHTSFGRLPVWYKQMTDAGYDSQAIQSWCTSFVLAQNLCSSDVDSLTNLTPEMINLLAAQPESNQITQCLFSSQATQHLQTDKDAFKRRLLLARLLNEFAYIAGQLKENLQVVRRIQEGVGNLCSTFLDDANATGNFYKIRYNILEDLFVLLFKGESDEHAESLRQLRIKRSLSKSLVILFRRLARSVVSRPITFGLIKRVVTTMLRHEVKDPNRLYQEKNNAIHLSVLNFESNQDAIHTLQCAGYNQSASMNEDLWYSSSIEMSAFVPTVKSFESSRKESLLRQLWREWKTILKVYEISEVEVNGQKVKQAELFKMSDSLETMETQLQSVQKAIKSKPLMQNNWSYYRQKQLLRGEKRLREKVVAQVKEVTKMIGTQLTKMVLVWENQLLDAVKMCSEKIPDCYAPNGFHSEKPVICGIAVDNRILTLYKEDHGGTRTELENVEIKLYPAGMVVFGAYRSIHPYDTEQMWAAFYKMLLDKRLVPKIFVTNISPAFDWIKQFVAPEVSSPRGINFISCCNLIPSSEDSFDYDPETELLAHHAVLASSQTKELIILTPEKTAELKIDSIRAPFANRKILKKHVDEVILHLKEHGQLKEMHAESRECDQILKRLRTPITKAVEISVDGGEPTQESISKSIDMKRLLPNRSQDTCQYSKDDYSSVILDAVNTVTGDLQGSRTSYDGCQHVVFLQPIQ